MPGVSKEDINVTLKNGLLTIELSKNETTSNDNVSETQDGEQENVEYFLLNEKKLDEAILLFYINENAIIIGKNQRLGAK